MRGIRAGSVASNPVLIGAVTALVVVVAVFLAYNANHGLPFVPAFELKVDTPDAARLVVGNDVREGGFRIGQVAAIAPVRRRGGSDGAQLTLRLDKVAAPVPVDSTVIIRQRSALGLKYVELVRGRSARALPDGAVLTAGRHALPPELDDVFDTFDEPTRRNIDANLQYFGAALAGRGTAINRTVAALPGLLGDLPPVMRNLADPDTRLVPLIDEVENATRLAAPLSDTLARGFTGMADTFEGLSRDPQALRDTISRAPALLEEGDRSLPATRPLLAGLAQISDEVRGSARQLRGSLPALNRALAIGTPVLRRTPRLNHDLETALRATRDLARSPTTDITLAGLTSTMDTLNPTLRWVGPHVTVCNYLTYFLTFLSDHLSDQDATGNVQRIQVKTVPVAQPNSMASFGAARPANGGPIDPVQKELLGDAVNRHDQIFGRAVDESGDADCETGQRGYPDRLASEFPPDLHIAVDPRTPGSQGPTFKGRPRVPAGETFSAEPTGRAPRVAP
ncbi:MAG: MlaD family protein [Actinomycetota bacterium]|nr:MlaD family protein [Actinomycetota bacterium]